MIDTGALTPYETAARIAEDLGAGTVPVCDIVQTPEPTAETVAAGVLLFDERDRVLLVDPTYKAGWEFPGGVVEPGEAPARAGVREVAEETGIQLEDVPRLLVVDWEPPAPPGYGGLRLLFDGGRLDSDRARAVLLPGPELRGWCFASEEEAAELCRRCATSGCGGRCGPGSAGPRCTWKPGFRSADVRERPRRHTAPTGPRHVRGMFDSGK